MQKIHLLILFIFIGFLDIEAKAFTLSCGNTGQNDDCPKTGANPVNPQKGNLDRTVRDIETFGAAPIEFIRYYNSRTRSYTKPRWELGTECTWQHNWQYEVRESSTTDYGFPRLIVRYPQGREYYFQAVDSTGSVRTSDASWGDRLYPNGSGQYILRTPEGKEFYFTKNGSGSNYQYLLTEVRNGTGWKWTLTYQTQSDGKQRLYRVTNNYGRYIQLSRFEDTSTGYWRITSVATNDGRSVSYGYSNWTPTSETVLTSVTYPDATQGIYSWCGSLSVSTGPPLLASANDAMQEGSGSRCRYVYNYDADYYASSPFGIVNGTIKEERNLVTDQVIVSLPLGSGEYPQVKEGNGTELTFKYSNGLIGQKADGEGRTILYERDSGGWGYVNKETTDDGAETFYTHDYAGRILTRTDAIGGVRTFTYNTYGFPLTETNELNRTITYTRNSSNQITRIDYPDSTYETFTYTGTGLMKTHRLRNSFTETLVYDSWGNLSSKTDAASYATTYTYYSNGLVNAKTDPRSFTVSYQYNWRGKTTRQIQPDSNFRQYAYTTYGQLSSFTDELGHIWSKTYTEYNQVASETDPLNRTTNYEYGREPGCSSCTYLPSLARITLPSGKKTEYHYDLSGKPISMVVAPGTADESTTSYVYDNVGLVEEMIDPLGESTTYTYDLLRRKTSETDPLSHITSMAYDAVGNILTVTRPDSGVTTWTYDTMNRVLINTNPKSEVTTFTYFNDDSLASLTDAKSQTSSFQVDALSRRTKITYPGSSYEQWTYDGAGNMTQYRNRTGQTMSCTFDNRNRETLCDYSDSTPDVSKSYDAAGRLVSAGNSNSASVYAYDIANQLISETQAPAGLATAFVVSYSYTVDGEKAGITYPNGTTITYAYTNRNQLKDVNMDGPPPLASYEYDGRGRRTKKTLENGVWTTYGYDNAGRLTSLSHEKIGSSLYSVSYALDAIGNRTGRSENSVTDTFGYDAIDQLTGVTYGAGGNAAYTYDAAGNRTVVTGIVPGAGSYSANSLNQYSMAPGGTPSYDAKGNLSGYGVRSYNYDFKNRLTSATNGSLTVAFTYDWQNRQVSRTTGGTTTYFIWDGWSLIEERENTGTLAQKYVHGADIDEILLKADTSSQVYYHEDGLGSVVLLTDVSGSKVESYKYDAYGDPTVINAAGTIITASSCGNRFMYTGREFLVEIGDYDYRNRFYSPGMGRFLQTDPIRFEAKDINLYRYAFNSPVDSTDPLGLYTANQNKDGTWVIDVEKCEIVILYGHGGKTPHKFTFGDPKCSAAAFAGCHSHYTNSIIPSNNRAQDAPDVEDTQGDTDNYNQLVQMVRSAAVMAKSFECCEWVKLSIHWAPPNGFWARTGEKAMGQTNYSARYNTMLPGGKK